MPSTTPEYDVIIVGARCAGSPAAMLLARKGYRVLLVDKSTFPSDIMSTHFIWQSGVARLKRWGLLEAVAASNCPPVTRFTLDIGPFALTGSPPPIDGVSEGYAPRRKVIDKILVDRAAAAGAEVREGFSVQEILMDGGRVTGIRGRARDGAMVTEHALLVIGADGMRSMVARAVRAPEYNVIPPLACGYYSYWSGVDCPGGEIYVREGLFFVGFPTNDGLVCVVALRKVEQFPQYRTNIEGMYLETLEAHPGFAARVRAGKREERFVGTADTQNFFRKPYGPGWALVGDAGYHKDPITAQGITDAFRDVELLVEAIEGGTEEAFAGYERRRNEAALPMYQSTCQRAALGPPPPEMVQLFNALRSNQRETDRFFGTDAGTVPIPEFFAPENIQRILSSSVQG